MTELRRFDVDVDGGVVRGRLAPGEIAFVDATGLGRVDRTGDRGAAAGAVAATARAVLAEVADLPAGAVAVAGDGALAALLRRLLGVVRGDGAPAAIVDTTGTTAAIAAAVRDVAPGGRVVLAAAPEADTVDVRTYADVHVRGLTVVGVPDGRGEPGEDDVDWLLGRLVDGELGQPCGTGVWYRVVAAAQSGTTGR